MADQEQESNEDSSQPSPGERGEALIMLREYARQGHAATGGTDDGFEYLWRTAFDFSDAQNLK
jgi:hypothetical protein